MLKQLLIQIYILIPAIIITSDHENHPIGITFFGIAIFSLCLSIGALLYCLFNPTKSPNSRFLKSVNLTTITGRNLSNREYSYMILFSTVILLGSILNCLGMLPEN